MFKVGDKIKIVENQEDHVGYVDGDILTIKSIEPNDFITVVEGGWFIGFEEVVKQIIERTDVWNPMVKLMNEHPDKDVRENAKMLLEQYNTAGGNRMRDELVFMLNKYGY